MAHLLGDCGISAVESRHSRSTPRSAFVSLAGVSILIHSAAILIRIFISSRRLLRRELNFCLFSVGGLCREIGSCEMNWFESYLNWIVLYCCVLVSFFCGSF